jgi:hypothetical protein
LDSGAGVQLATTYMFGVNMYLQVVIC